MKPIIVLLIAIFILAGTAAAKPQSVELGPYSVEFDLGKVCSVVSEEPEEGETLNGAIYTTYTLQIRSKEDESASIIINRLKNGILSTSSIEYIDSLKKEVEDIFKGMGLAVYDVSYREIDGKSGVVGYGRDPRFVGTIYMAEYSPDDRTAVKLMSFYPLEEGTLDLIKTIHVEMAGNEMSTS